MNKYKEKSKYDDERFLKEEEGFLLNESRPITGREIRSLNKISGSRGYSSFSRSGRSLRVRSMACSSSQLRIFASLPESSISGTFHPL